MKRIEKNKQRDGRSSNKAIKVLANKQLEDVAGGGSSYVQAAKNHDDDWTV
jgi:hypothetical protein